MSPTRITGIPVCILISFSLSLASYQTYRSFWPPQNLGFICDLVDPSTYKFTSTMRRRSSIILLIISTHHILPQSASFLRKSRDKNKTETEKETERPRKAGFWGHFEYLPIQKEREAARTLAQKTQTMPRRKPNR